MLLADNKEMRIVALAVYLWQTIFWPAQKNISSCWSSSKSTYASYTIFECMTLTSFLLTPPQAIVTEHYRILYFSKVGGVAASSMDQPLYTKGTSVG